MNNFLKSGLLILFLSLIIISCKEDEDNTQPLGESAFQSTDYFKATINGKNYRVNKGTTFADISPSKTSRASSSNSISVVGFGNYVKLDNQGKEDVRIYFSRSFHDSSLVDYTSFNSSGHTTYNPFKNSNTFHEMFAIGEGEYFYSSGHGKEDIPEKIYWGLVVEYRKGNETWKSYTRIGDYFYSATTNTYEVLNYKVINKDRVGQQSDMSFQPPSGRVKIKFDCTLYLGSESNKMELNGGEFQITIAE